MLITVTSTFEELTARRSYNPLGGKQVFFMMRQIRIGRQSERLGQSSGQVRSPSWQWRPSQCLWRAAIRFRPGGSLPPGCRCRTPRSATASRSSVTVSKESRLRSHSFLSSSPPSHRAAGGIGCRRARESRGLPSPYLRWAVCIGPGTSGVQRLASPVGRLTAGRPRLTSPSFYLPSQRRLHACLSPSPPTWPHSPSGGPASPLSHPRATVPLFCLLSPCTSLSLHFLCGVTSNTHLPSWEHSSSRCWRCSAWPTSTRNTVRRREGSRTHISDLVKAHLSLEHWLRPRMHAIVIRQVTRRCGYLLTGYSLPHGPLLELQQRVHLAGLRS